MAETPRPQVNIRLSAETVARIDAIAAAEERSRSNVARRLIEQRLDDLEREASSTAA